MDQTLQGKTVALAETRELDVLARMFEERGAKTVRCPLVGIRDAQDAAPIEAWLDRFIALEMQDLILMTGEGLRRLGGFAERGGRRGDFLAALGRVRKITRGPKPVRALREMGLASDLVASAATTEGIMSSLAELDLAGRRVGLQLYGQDPNEPMQAFLRAKNAGVDPVAPYVYVAAAEDAEVIALIEKIAAGAIDAIAFTSAAQVRRLHEAAAESGRAALLAEGLKRMRVAAVGPVVAKELAGFGIINPLVPTRAFAMKPLVNEIERGLAMDRGA